MSAFLKTIFVAMFALVSLGAAAQTAYSSNQSEIDQLRFKQMQIEWETMRLQAETERLQRETAKPNSIFEELAKREAEQKIAADRAEEITKLQEQIQIANTRSANNIYGLLFATMLFGIGFYIRKRMAMNSGLNFNQKFGVLVMIFSAIAFLFLLVISDNWNPHFDVIWNLLIIRIQLWQDGWQSYLIDFPTKYAFILVVIGFFYGFATYLGITPALERARLFMEANK